MLHVHTHIAYAWQQHLWPPVFDVLLPIELLELLQRLACLLVAHALEAVAPLRLHLTQLDVQVERHHHDDRGQRKVPGLGLRSGVGLGSG